MPQPIFVGGTCSHAGKSWMTAAICKHLTRRGLRVAPFKAQNMSLNSYPCREGGEIGRAQVMQAAACGLEPRADMNPILLKPHSQTGSQVILNGKLWRNLEARDYYEHFPVLLDQVLAAFNRLRDEFDCVVIEGAGSVSEINFRDRDLVNLGLAARVNANALLVADIDRGGVFASVAGSFCVLDPDERALIRSFAINRLRGDAKLFSGIEVLERKTARRCLGVFPWLDDVRLEEEDSVWFEEMPAPSGFGANVAILRFPHASNFTDFQLLPGARWVSSPEDRRFRLVILPGSKNTISDLNWMRARGLDQWIRRQHAAGATILGICGGYQMLGERIEDPYSMESNGEPAEGLGLIPGHTLLAPDKTTRVVGAISAGGHPFRAYEIHVGRTTRPKDAAPFASVDGEPEGIRAGRVIGTYLHGALEDPGVVEEVLGERPPDADRDGAFERLADWFETHADARLFEELYL